MNKKLSLGLIILLILIIIIPIFTPILKNIFNNKIIEGATQSTQISTSSLTQEQSIKEQIAQNLNNISDDKQKIQEYIQLRNNATDPNIDITTSTARLDYSSLENKSLHLQIILLSSILLIIIIAIIIAYMS